MNPYEYEYQFRDIELQSNLRGYYEPRIRCSPEQIQFIPHNHRRAFLDEVIWDIDTHIPEIYNPVADRISIRLQKDNISHQYWFTSRSPHIHCFFEGLSSLSEDARSLLKSIIMKEYSQEDFQWIDKGKRSSNVMIRDFDALHEVTNKRKELLYEWINPSQYRLNAIPAHILSKFRIAYTNINEQKEEALKGFNGANPVEQAQMREFVESCLAHRFVNTHGMMKNSLLFKNLSIALHILGYNNAQVEAIDQNLTRHCGHIRGGIKGWFMWCKKQSHPLKVNWKEVEVYQIKWE